MSFEYKKKNDARFDVIDKMPEKNILVNRLEIEVVIVARTLSSGHPKIVLK